MSRPNGQHLPAAIRNQAIQTIQSLIAAGVSDDEIREQIEERFEVSERTVRDWMVRAYAGLAAEVEEDRRQLLGVALRRRRIVMARAAKKGDWRTYLSAADSEARLLGLEAPRQLEHHVLVEKARDMSRVVVDVVKSFFAGDLMGQDRFVRALRERLSLALLQRRSPELFLLEKDSEPEETLGSKSLDLESDAAQLPLLLVHPEDDAARDEKNCGPPPPGSLDL